VAAPVSPMEFLTGAKSPLGLLRHPGGRCPVRLRPCRPPDPGESKQGRRRRAWPPSPIPPSATLSACGCGGRLVRARRSKVQWPASHVASLANPAVRPPGPASRSQRSLQRCTPQPQITPQVRFDLGTSLLPFVIRLGKFIDHLFY